ncbi:MAG: hypothetical protein KGH93_01770 [Patescibacteria group bacterium]|nr:hypothetical protein [Patescibacteria group bacterium]MDE1945905.1 hypothetical protein [Patescibacteria group bacterium]
MRTSYKIWLPVAAGAALFCAGFAVASMHSANLAGETKVLYSLDARENDREIIKLIDGAKQFAYFAVYTFTKKNIADALVAAKSRGIDVRGITDRDEAATDYEKPILAELSAAGIPVETQTHPDGIMHIKALVTDKAYAIGSYNWTSSATVANDEILEIGTDETLRQEYLAIIEKVIAANAATSTGAAASAAAPPVSISFSEAGNYIGRMASVSGVPVNIYTSSGGTVFFDYCTNYKSCPFSVVIFADDAKKFKNIAEYTDVPITVTGMITSYGGKAEINVSDPGQIGENSGG